MQWVRPCAQRSRQAPIVEQQRFCEASIFLPGRAFLASSAQAGRTALALGCFKSQSAAVLFKDGNPALGCHFQGNSGRCHALFYHRQWLGTVDARRGRQRPSANRSVNGLQRAGQHFETEWRKFYENRAATLFRKESVLIERRVLRLEQKGVRSRSASGLLEALIETRRSGRRAPANPTALRSFRVHVSRRIPPRGWPAMLRPAC